MLARIQLHRLLPTSKVSDELTWTAILPGRRVWSHQYERVTRA